MTIKCRMLRSRTWFVLLAVGMALAAGSTASATTTAASETSTVTRAASLEELVLRQVNAVRAARHLAPFIASGALSRSAAAHSRSMLTRGFFAHESANGASFSSRIRGFYGPRSSTWTVGENLAMFGGMTPTADAVVDAWMGSPGHRANLLRGSFREAGVAVMFNPAAGGMFGGEATWVVTLDLGRR
jgi:uncharacterized protein YkwD